MACVSRLHLPLKRRDSVRGGKFAAVSALFLAVQCIYMVATDGFEGVAWNLCMAVSVFLMFCYIRAGAATSRNNAAGCCCTAFIASEFAASFEWQIWCYIHEHFDIRLKIWGILILLLVYGIVFICIWQINKNISSADEEFTVTGKETVLIVVATLLIFAVSNLGFLPVSVPFCRERQCGDI